MPDLKDVRVAILATDGFEQVELTRPREALHEAGAQVHVIAPESGSITGWDETDWGDDVEVDIPLDEADPADYDALVLPGGQINPDKLRINDVAVTFVKAIAEAGKPVAAICHAPWTLINAELVSGRRMTSYKSIRVDLVNAGANWTDEEVVTDDGPFCLITSRNPDDLPAFNEAVLKQLSARAEAAPAGR